MLLVGGGVVAVVTRVVGAEGVKKSTAARVLSDSAADKRPQMADGKVIKVRRRGASLRATSWLTADSAAIADTAAPTWDVTG